jgi:deoxyadenosine/deoxycytidine kinase
MHKKNSDNSTPIFLIIVGNIASGKSTATNILAKALKIPFIEADLLFQTTNPYREDFLSDMSRWALANELWMTVNRVKILKNYAQENGSNVVLVDSGLLMSWVYTFAHQSDGVLDQRDWSLYQQLFSTIAQDFNRNIRVLHLDYSIPTLLERVARRGREYELQYYTAHYLSSLNRGIGELVKSLKKQSIPVQRISEEKISDFEHDDEQQKEFVKVVQQFSR